MQKEKFFSAKRVTGIAVLLALVIVLQGALGSVSVGGVQLNFSLIPIVLGAAIYGATVGGVLGFACGVVVLVQVITGGGFYAVIWTNSPIVTTLTCLLKTTAAGVFSGLAYEAIAKKNKTVATFVSAAIVPIVNSALFIAGCLCMSGSIAIFQSSLGAYTDMNALVFILVVLVTFNFFIELAINLIVAPTLCRVIGIVAKNV